jgi:hypothetical protein
MVTSSRPVSTPPTKGAFSQMSRIESLWTKIEDLKLQTFRQLRDTVLGIHNSAGGCLFNPAVVQSILGIETSKRWCSCSQHELEKLLKAWYTLKIEQARIDYWESGYLKHSHNPCIVSQRAAIQESSTFNWTTYWGMSTKREAYAKLKEVAPHCKVAMVRKGGKATGQKWEVKAWMVKDSFLYSQLGLEGWNEYSSHKIYPYDGDDTQIQARGLAIRENYRNAQNKGDLTLLKRWYTHQELVWVANWVKNSHPQDYENMVRASQTE